MTTWLIRRLIQALFVLLAMSVIVFIGVHVIGNPVDILISPEADQAERARVIAALGLDQPHWRIPSRRVCRTHTQAYPDSICLCR